MNLKAFIALGWTPQFAIVNDGARRVQQVVGWIGGAGTSPVTGQYVGSTGFVANVTDGVDIRGGAGGGGGAAISAGGVSQNTGTVNFSNSNGVSFGLSANGVMTASFSNAVQTQYSFSNGNGVTFGTAGSTVTASVQTNYLTTAMQSNAATISNINVSAGTTSNNLSALTFSNGNGVSFGLNGSVITATVATNYQSQGAYLTTARASNDAIGTNTALTANGVSMTANSGGLSLNFPAFLTTAQPVGAYLTTAMLSNASTNFAGIGSAITNGTMTFGTGGLSLNLSNHLTTAMQSNAATISNIKISAGLSSSNVSAVTFSNGNGVSFGYDGTVITASVAAAGGAQTAISGISAGTTQMTSGTAVFSNSNGVSFGVNGNTITATVATNYQSQGAYLTTAMQSNAATISNINLSAGTTSGNISNFVFSNSNGVSFGLNGSTVTATVATNYQSQGAYLTTAMQSNAGSNFAGLNTALTANGVAWTVNSSGISLNVPAFLTTAALSNHSHGNPTLALTNISGTTASNSAGLTLSLSAGAGGGVNPVASASNGSFSFTTLNFSNANNVTFGTSAGGIITASVGAGGGGGGIALAASNTTFTSGTVVLSNAGGALTIGTGAQTINFSVPSVSSLSATGAVSMFVNGSTISIGVPAAVTYSRYNEYKESPMTEGAIGQASLHLQPWLIPNLQFDRVVLHKAFSNASNSSFSFTVSDWVGIYTKNVSSLSLLYSASVSTNFSGSGTVGSYLSYGGGIKAMTLGLTQTLTEGMYWLGIIQRTTTGGGAGHTLNQMLNSQAASTYRGLMGAATNTSNQMSLGFGVYSASTSAMPASIAFSEVQGNSSIFLRPPSIYFVSGTI